MGLDIGGANTDCAIIEINDEKQIKSIKKSTNVLSKRPIWNSVGIFENTRPF